LPSYRYKGTDPNGEELTGTVVAASPSEAEADIRKVYSSLSDIDIEEIPEKPEKPKKFEKLIKSKKSETPEEQKKPEKQEKQEKQEKPEAPEIFNSLGNFREKFNWEKLTGKFRSISAKALAKSCRQISISLKSGQSPEEALDLAASHTGDRKLASILRQVSGDMSGGKTLSLSLEERGAALPEAFRECVRAGETSNDLAGAFERLEDYCAGMGNIRRRTVSALIYPVLLIIAAAAVLSVVMGRALPALTAALVGLGAELPWGTRALLGLSDFFENFGPVLLILIVLAVIGLYIWSGTEDGGQRLSSFRLRLPVVGNVARMSGAGRFARTMSLMLASGLSKAEAMDIAARTVSSRTMAREIQEAVHDVKAGRSLGDSLSGLETLPEQLVRVAASGEKDGTLEDALRSLAEYFSDEAEDSTAKALSVLEAIVIAVVAVLIILVLAAVYLPMLGMYSPA